MTQLPPAVAAFVKSINDSDPEAFVAMFADNATVDDAGRMFHGRDAIKEWSDRDIFAVHVTLEPVHVDELSGEVVLTTKVDGTFERTGLPDPLRIDQSFHVAGGKIVRLKCRLAGTSE